MLKLEVSKALKQPDVIISYYYSLVSFLCLCIMPPGPLKLFFSLLSFKVFCGHNIPFALSVDLGISMSLNSIAMSLTLAHFVTRPYLMGHKPRSNS